MFLLEGGCPELHRAKTSRAGKVRPPQPAARRFYRAKMCRPPPPALRRFFSIPRSPAVNHNQTRRSSRYHCPFARLSEPKPCLGFHPASR
jgi:hypothetical protein